jgi:uroporphyrinogen decarboxylase
MTDQMTPSERIRAALVGHDVDRVPIGLWRHFPGEDSASDDLVNATVRFQHVYRPDLVKLMPTGMYSVVDYGVEIEPTGDSGGTTRYVSGPVSEPADWGRLPSVSPEHGVLRDQVEVTRRVRDALGPDIPIIQTVFGPLTMANKAIGDVDALRRHLDDAPDQVRPALEQFTDDVIAFGKACIDAGVDGFFFATQLGNRSALGESCYREHGVPYDLRVLEALRPGTWFTMLHLHGGEPLFDLADEYPVDCVNWHDRETPPSLSEAHKMTNRCLVGGINRSGVIVSGSPDDVAAEVRDAIAQTGGRRLIVTPGCVIPCDAPADNFHAARSAAAAST